MNTNLLLLLLLLLLILLSFLLRWHYGSMRTSSQSPLIFYLSFYFVILHLLVSACTQFHPLFFGCPVSRLRWRLFLTTWLLLLLLSILLKCPLQFNRLIVTNESISKWTPTYIYVNISLICSGLRIEWFSPVFSLLPFREKDSDLPSVVR